MVIFVGTGEGAARLTSVSTWEGTVSTLEGTVRIMSVSTVEETVSTLGGTHRHTFVRTLEESVRVTSGSTVEEAVRFSTAEEIDRHNSGEDIVSLTSGEDIISLTSISSLEDLTDLSMGELEEGKNFMDISGQEEEEGISFNYCFNSDTSEWDFSEDDGADTGHGWTSNIDDLDLSCSDESSQHGHYEEEMEQDDMLFVF